MDESETCLLQALDLSKTPTQRIQNLIRLAHTYQWKNQFSRARSLFEEAFALIGSSEVSVVLRAACHQHFGKFYFDQRLYDLAISEFEMAFKLRTENAAPQDQIQSTLLALNTAKQFKNP